MYRYICTSLTKRHTCKCLPMHTHTHTHIHKLPSQTHINTLACRSSDTQVEVSFSALSLVVVHECLMYTCCTEEQRQYHKHTAKTFTSTILPPNSPHTLLDFTFPNCCVIVFSHNTNTVQITAFRDWVDKSLSHTKKTNKKNKDLFPVSSLKTPRLLFLRHVFCVFEIKIEKAKKCN